MSHDVFGNPNLDVHFRHGVHFMGTTAMSEHDGLQWPGHNNIKPIDWEHIMRNKFNLDALPWDVFLALCVAVGCLTFLLVWVWC